jgi:hypothetical protein
MKTTTQNKQHRYTQVTQIYTSQLLQTNHSHISTAAFGFLQVCFHRIHIRATCPSLLILLGFITAISDIFITLLLQHPVLLPPPS